jgi:hypothetical protein
MGCQYCEDMRLSLVPRYVARERINACGGESHEQYLESVRRLMARWPPTQKLALLADVIDLQDNSIGLCEPRSRVGVRANDESAKTDSKWRALIALADMILQVTGYIIVPTPRHADRP